MRERFINGLVDSKILDKGQAESILKVPYNPEASLGSDTVITEIPPAEGNLEDLAVALSAVQFDFSDLIGNKQGSDTHMRKNGQDIYSSVTLADILNNNICIIGSNWDNEDLRGNDGYYDYTILQRISGANYWKQLYTALESVLYTDGKAGAALNYAKTKMSEKLEVILRGGDSRDFEN